MTARASGIRRDVLVSAALAAAVVLVYGRMLGHDFVSYDDPGYVVENARVRAGLTADNVVWAFTSLSLSNWHPLTWLSYMLDCSVYGVRAPGFLMTNMTLHALNSVLLFWVLRRATAAPWRSALVAGLFAVHPAHVESVAWVAERKDVLSGLCWMLAVAAYVWYARKRTPGRYAAVVIAFTLGLMAKPMVVTLPFVLLLLDYWPLGRAPSVLPVAKPALRAWARLFVEKAPLLALAALACWLTLVAQRRGAAVKPLEQFALSARAANAVAAYVEYIRMAVWPKGLAVFYPHPGNTLPLWRVVLSAGLLVAVTVGVIWGRRRGYLPTGWFWYLGTLAPVIGLVQVGDQGYADRYTYLPLIGLSVVLVWGAHDLVARLRRGPVFPGIAAACWLAVLAAAAFIQVGYWRDSRTLYERALNVTRGNHLAHYNLGNLCRREGDTSAAAQHYREVLRIKPGHMGANTNLGLIFSDEGRYTDAVAHFEKALETSPDDFRTHYNLGNTLLMLGRAQEAVTELRAALEMKPDHPGVHVNLGNALSARGELAKACEHFQTAVVLEPTNANAHFNLGNTRLTQGRLEDAARAFAKVVRLDPADTEARQLLEAIRAELEQSRPETN